MNDGDQVCASCGAPAAQAQSQARPQAAEILDQADHTAEFDPADIEQSKIVSLFSYLGILFLVPLLAKPESRFAKFHVNQGLVLFLTDLICFVAAGILSLILLLIPVVGAFVSGLIYAAVSVILLILMILGIVNAVTGKAKELPIIGKIKILH